MSKIQNPSKRIQMSDGAALHVEDKGDGPAVLFSHGLSGSARNWRGNLSELTDFRCIAYDVRGHARSDVTEEEAFYQSDRLTQDMSDILSAKDISSAAFVGTSMGAMLSLLYATQYPERVRGLVLSSLPNSDPTFRGVASYAQQFAKAIRMEGLEKAGEQFVWGPQSGLSERDASFVRMGFLEHSGVGLANILSGFLAKLESLELSLSRITELEVPVLFVAGSRDKGAIHSAETFKQTMPWAALEIVPDAGHLVNIEKKTAFNHLLKEFLAKVA